MRISRFHPRIGRIPKSHIGLQGFLVNFPGSRGWPQPNRTYDVSICMTGRSSEFSRLSGRWRGMKKYAQKRNERTLMRYSG
jgi:hypothetical protein